MYIANAVFQSEQFGKTRIAICTKSEDELAMKSRDTDFFFHTHIDKPIAKAVMKAAAQSVLPTTFTLNGIKYSLLSYATNDDERFYNKYRKNYVVRKERMERHPEIFVYSERCRCSRCYAEYGFDGIESICGVFSLESTEAKVEIDLQKCQHCGRYFMDQESLKMYEQRYGKIRMVTHKITGNEIYSLSWDINFYNPDSILSRHGYYASLPMNERKRKLVRMMEQGVSKAEIKDTLTRFIVHRSRRCPYAADAWRHDLKFVNDFELDRQRAVLFEP